MNTNSKKILLDILSRALLDIRIASYEGKTKVAFALSDLFHNIPNQIYKADMGDKNYQNILTCLELKAKQKKIESWLNHALKEVQKSND